MKIISIIGARPQFIKAAVIHRELLKHEAAKSIIVHTGQHYDDNMSQVFFDELNIPVPDYNLGVGSATHGVQTGRMIQRLEEVVRKENPAWCIVYGDTNSTIAGALVSIKLHIPVAHVEAGLRSFNRKMPEEINRIATDHISSLLFAPTKIAANILKQEGLKNRTIFSGDVMYDSILHYKSMINEKKSKLKKINQPYYVSTIHRQENTDNQQNLSNIFKAFSKINKQIILPLHPRTKKFLRKYNIHLSSNINVVKPVSYLYMLELLVNCEKVITDSGGLQKEAYFLRKPCISLRDETEWLETLDGKWNQLAGCDIDRIIQFTRESINGNQKRAFGDGHAAEKIINKILNTNIIDL